jgi:NarL family two-component system sensor histidine kinase LiaS
VALAIQQQDLLPGALYFILLSSIVGTLSGLLASRSIRRRLRRIAQAAHLWSRGELQTAIRDPGRDELGQVALDLNSMAAQLQQLMVAREALAVVEERHRLARDLHDSVKQQLFVVTMLLGTAQAQVGDTPEAARTLAEAERLAAQAQQELTGLIRALRPLALANKGLGAALRELLADWGQRTGIAVRASIVDELPLRLAAEQELFRMAQEALTNVARHSGAASVEVCAEVSGGTILLSVADDGHGFDPAAVSQGLGLSGMRERVEAVGGMLLIYSGAVGTRIEAQVPSVSPPVAIAGRCSPRRGDRHI